MDSHAPVPDDKRCGRCGRTLQWLGHGRNDLDADESMREGIFECTRDGEVWVYLPRKQEWRRQA